MHTHMLIYFKNNVTKLHKGNFQDTKNKVKALQITKITVKSYDPVSQPKTEKIRHIFLLHMCIHAHTHTHAFGFHQQKKMFRFSTCMMCIVKENGMSTIVSKPKSS